MKIAAITVALALTGCASTERLQATVGNASNFELCRAIMLAPPNVSNIAREEATRRSLDCGPYAAMVIQQKQASDASADAYIQRLMTPPAPAPRRTTNCTSQRLGNTIDTHCW